jgi:C-terminal peptidase prc
VVNENYLYPDFNGLNWDAVHVEYRQRIEAGLSEEDFYLAMSEMINRLGDEHSVFLSPEEAAQADADIEGDYSYVGIGITTAAIPERNLLTIVLVFPGSAAEEAGLQMHDNILAVDGQPIIDESGVRRDLLRGPVGTSVVLTVQTPNQEPRQVPVIRRQVTGELPVPYQALTSPQGRRIGYIMIPTFFDNNVDDQVRDALLEMGEVGPLDGLILDNRMNAGGLSNVFIDTLALFSEGMLGYFDVRGSDAALDVEANDIFGSQSLPLVVLVDSGTVSFGEIFAGILQDTRRAHLIGERTDGNVEILLAYSFSDGSRAWIANQTFRPLNHPEQDWEQTGIVPDQTVVTNWDQETMDTDPAIQAALEHLDAAQSPGLAEIPGALRLSTAWFIASSAPLW